MKDKIKTAYKFLFDNAQSIVRNEAAIALGIQSDKSRSEMVRHPLVQYWIECLQRFMSKPQIHNSADTCLENWMHKLLSFGICESDDKRLSSANSHILRYLETNRGNEISA